MLGFTPGASGVDEPAAASDRAGRPGEWKHSPLATPKVFPIAVWLQSPSNAARFKAAGINLFVGLWNGPTQAQLDQLAAAGMRVICAQNPTALAARDNPLIVGWMHGDEPDNAQALPGRGGYGPPIEPEVIGRDYRRIRAADPSRPVLLNLGQGVAWDDWIGRGVRRNHPEDYPRYLEGCDLASFDIYPVVHDSPQVAGKLEFVARGVGRLVEWTRGAKPVWSCIECTHISNPARKATPAQVRSEVWMAVIRGASGLIYFVHQFKPSFREAALLDDPEMLAAVTAINARLQSLAPALHAPTVADGVIVTSGKANAPIAAIMKRAGGDTFVFAVNLGSEPTTGAFVARGTGDASIEVLDESRTVALTNGRLSDEFDPYAVHLYKLGHDR
jgi:hypothetical protein